MMRAAVLGVLLVLALGSAGHTQDAVAEKYWDLRRSVVIQQKRADGSVQVTPLVFGANDAFREQLWAEAEREVLFEASKRPPPPPPTDPKLEGQSATLYATAESWTRQWQAGQREWARSASTSARTAYELEYAVAGYVKLYEATADLLYLRAAAQIVNQLVEAWPWQGGTRRVLDELKGVYRWPDFIVSARSRASEDPFLGETADRAETFVRERIAGYWFPRPFGSYPSFTEWCRRVHLEEPPTQLGGYVQGHQSLAGALSRRWLEVGLGDPGGQFAGLADLTLSIAASRAFEVTPDGRALWSPGRYPDPRVDGSGAPNPTRQRDSWHGGREVVAFLDLGGELTTKALVRTFDWISRQDEHGTLTLTEYIDGMQASMPGNGQVYEGWCELARWDRVAWDRCWTVFERVVNGPKSGLAYNLATHPEHHHREIALAGTLVEALRKRTW